MRARIVAAPERPVAELVEVALDHRLDVDAGLSRADDDARHPAARVRDARAAAAPYANAAGGRRVAAHSHFLQERAASKKLALALLGTEPGQAAPIARTECAPRLRERLWPEVGDARRGYPGLPGHRRNT